MSLSEALVALFAEVGGFYTYFLHSGVAVETEIKTIEAFV